MDEELKEVGLKWSAQELDRDKEYLININCTELSPQEITDTLNAFREIFNKHGFTKCIFTVSYSDRRMTDLYEICKKENLSGKKEN